MLDLNNQELLHTITTYGYPVMFLLMIIEGPIATISAAFLASLGLFNPVVVYALSVLGDIVGDVILYWLGYHGGGKFLKKAEKFLKIKESLVKKLEHLFQTKGARIIFSVKSTTGLVYITFILAGATKMNFKKFLYYSFLGGLVWSALLVTLGYFFGQAAEQLSTYIKYAGIGIFVLAVASVFIINYMKKGKSQEIIE